MILDVTQQLETYGEYADAIAPTITLEEITRRRGGVVSVVSAPHRAIPNWVAAVGTSIAAIVLIGGAVWLLGGTELDVVDEPMPVTTIPIEVTVPVVPPTTIAGAYNLDDALAQVQQFHELWNNGEVKVSDIVAGLHPDSIHRQDQHLIDIAVNGFHAEVEAQCTAAPGADNDRANVTCHLLVEDDFYTSAGIQLQTEVVYEVTADSIDILEGEPIWAIEPTGTALAFLEDFDAELAGPLGGMMDTFGWIWLDPSVGTPNWGDGPPLRAYSVETVQDAVIAVSAVVSEFLHKEGDPWEPVPVIVQPVIPAPQNEPRACAMPVPISDVAFEAWFVDLHGAIGALVEDTNSLGVVLLETEDFSPGWQNRKPISSTLMLLAADLDLVETMATVVLQDNFGATYDEESGWKFPDGIVVLPGISHLEEVAYGPTHYRSNVLPAFFEMRSQGTAIGYFNSGGLTNGPCGAAASLVLLLDTMTESGLFRTP